MPSQKCIENVAAASPPFNTHCDPQLCAEAQATIDGHCRTNSYKPDDPWLMRPNGVWCNCCCSCYGYDTPIEASPGVFVKVQDVATGDTILAAGLGLAWVPTKVAFASGMASTTPGYPILNVVFRFAPQDVRMLLVTDDTLFLMASNALKTASVLVPGDRLRRADGGEAEVIGPVTKGFVTGVHSIELGPFNGKDLDGHLINSFGVVTTDFSVQRVISTGREHDRRLVDESVRNEDQLVAGTEEYLTKYAPSAAFLAEVEAAGIRIHPASLQPPKALIAVPDDAKHFLAGDQAETIRRRAPRFSSTNTFRITVTEKLIEMARTGCNDVVMLIDWHNASPNAYAWTQLRQRFVVLTGGLLRVKALTEAGLALILVQMQAYHADITCTGDAAAEAINTGLRRLWPQALFPLMCEQGVKEVGALFGFVGAEQAQGDPRSRCDRPSLDCLLKVYEAALSAQPVPECAKPEADDSYRPAGRGDAMLPELAEHVAGLEWDQAREAVGRVIGLPTPVPAAALRRAMVEDGFCRALLALPADLARVEQLVNDPRNGRFTLAGDGSDAAGASPRPQPASTTGLVVKAGAALTRWAASGFARVDGEAFERRWGACTACPELVDAPDSWVYNVTMSSQSDGRVCGACGCVAIRKARLSSERCPRPDPAQPGLSRWGEGL